MRFRPAILSLAVLAAFWGALSSYGAESKNLIPSGKVTMATTRIGAGLGFSWGDGTLRFKGKDFKFKVKGLNAISVGITSLRARGEVYNLEHLSDFPGRYYTIEGGGTLVKGRGELLMKNSRGVIISLRAERTGADLRLGDEGLSISPAWE